MNTAEKIAAMLGNDGQNFTTADGSTFDSILESHPHESADDSDTHRYTFRDGSVLTVQGQTAWDIGFAGCFCWQGNGHDSECAEA